MARTAARMEADTAAVVADIAKVGILNRNDACLSRTQCRVKNAELDASATARDTAREVRDRPL
jgi:hypothetical protein